jgi:hypothetical protein
MSTPTTDNQTADILNGVVSALMSGGEKAAEVFVTGLAPAFFGNPITQWLLDEGISYIGQILSIAGQKFVDSLVIDAQTNWEKSDVLDSGTALALALASKDPAAIQTATNNLSQAYKAVVNFDGWSTPS